jgi:hypothetical protein
MLKHSSQTTDMNHMAEAAGLVCLHTSAQNHKHTSMKFSTEG